MALAAAQPAKLQQPNQQSSSSPTSKAPAAQPAKLQQLNQQSSSNSTSKAPADQHQIFKVP